MVTVCLCCFVLSSFGLISELLGCLSFPVCCGLHVVAFAVVFALVLLSVSVFYSGSAWFAQNIQVYLTLLSVPSTSGYVLL